MYLKEITLNGFKSFADKLKIELRDNITVIVGPNGSGKSNIVDAVRWALGEQSAYSLRGEKMEDVIFSGSLKRKPLGRAEVSLLFDNSDGELPLDYSEILITRRVTRSGISEYFINKNLCRLKDIQELFMDTGLGQENYSIICQGKIDSFLNKNEEQKREFFEEAAGIKKYKTRKRETVKRLKKTEDNLNRITDLISELNNRLGPLKEQAEEAEEYKKIKSELKEHQKDYYLFQLNRVREEISSLNSKLNNLRDKLKKKKKDLKKLKGTYTELRKNDEAVEGLLDLHRDALNKLQDSQLKSENRIEIARQKKESIMGEIERIENEIDVIKKNREESRIRREDLKKKISESRKKLVTKNRLLEEKKDVYRELNDDLNQAEDRLSKYNEKLMNIVNELAEAKKHIEINKNRCDDLKNTIAEDEDKKQNLGRLLEKLKKARKNILEKTKKNEKKLKEQKENAEKLREDIDHNREKVETISGVKQKKERRCDQLEARLSSLIELKNSHQGYYKGVRAVLEKFGSEEGYYGAAASLIQTPKKIEKAVSVALGSRMQHLITQSSEEAEKAIAYLKKSQKGRATFIPLESISGRPSFSNEEKKILQEDGVVGLAGELVDYKPMFKPAVNYLLGRVIIADNLNAAISLKKNINFFLRIVTLDGEMINPGGAISGGKVQDRTFLLSRRREIKEHKNNISELKKELKGIEKKEYKLLKNRERLQKKHENLREKMIKDRMNNDNLKKEESRIKEEIEKFEDEREKLCSREKELHIKLKEYMDNHKNIIKKAESLEDDKEELGKMNSRLKDQIAEIKADRASFEKEFTELKVNKASVEQKYRDLKEQLISVQNRLEKFTPQINQKKKNLQELTDEIQELNNRISEEKEELSSILSSKRDKEEKLIEIKKEREENRKKIEELEADIEKVSSEVEKNDKEIQEVEITLARKETMMKSQEERLVEEFFFEQEDIKNIETELIDKDLKNESYRKKVSERIDSLEKKLSIMGDINLRAINDYRSEKKRHEFLSYQYDDLCSARSDLYNIIEKLDRIMEERFLTSFKSIRKRFKELFAGLFDGGEADLLLTDQDRPLSSGVELFAQPPGKKLKNIDLLSGGERTLIAIALNFSLMQSDPGSVYILDEVDAALDEINIERFLHFLELFSEKSQFIVVSHQKETLERADTLYGVTMQEKGVSNLVSVHIEQARSQAG